jgi:rhamnogalacturonan endolyase
MSAPRSIRKKSLVRWLHHLRRGGISSAMPVLAYLLLAMSILRCSGQETASVLLPVAVIETAAAYTLTNAFVTARVDRQSGDLVSLRYRNRELLGFGSGHPAGYWSHTPTRGTRTLSSVTIDPAHNSGERAEVSVKGFYGGTALGQGPGGSVAADIEIRYALGRADHGLYTYSIFDHKPDYPATSVGEARFGAKLDDRLFDYMAIDARRSKIMITAEDWDKGTPLNMKEARRMTTGRYSGQVEHKYDYSAVQFDTPAFGWYSTGQNFGIWFVNPTIEYLSGGATKVELTGHRDVSIGAAPTLLNYWRGSHYGGSECSIAQGEAWSKVIGPFLIYCNTDSSPVGAWKDALAQAARETAKWPFDWVKGVDYPHRDQRGGVRGQLVLRDPQAPTASLENVLVGLTPPDYPLSAGGRASANQTVDWQRDAKFYQFWSRADAHGNFHIPNVRPGKYTLHAIADGVLGEYIRTDIVIAAGRSLALGALAWQPVRYGKQVWEIGVPNRSAEEFRHGDHYWEWGLYLKYPGEFPNDVHFMIGKSDFRSDWNYCQPPRDDGKPTVWSIHFRLTDTPQGKATLRLAFAATSARRVAVAVNDKPAGDTGALMDTATIRRDGIRGYWYERDVAFDATLMQRGDNVLTLTIPAGGVMSGIEYDYLRLEVAAAP